MLITSATFAVVAGIVLGVYWLFIVRPEQHDAGALKRRMKAVRPKTAAAVDLLRPEQPLSNVSGIARLLAHAGGIAGPIQKQIEQAGLTMTVGVVVLASLCLAVAAFAVVMATTRLWVAAVLVGACAQAVPFLFLRFKAARRLSVFEEQFPEALDLMARALRAGHAFSTALAMAAEETPKPVGEEFRLVHDRQNYGMPLTDALRDMARRMPLLDARFFVTAILMQRESGGNLAEVLDNLAALMRDRFKVKRQVRTLSAHGRITGLVLACLAPALAAILWVLAPEHIAVMFQDPLGIQITVGALVMQVIGVLVIRKIVNIEV